MLPARTHNQNPNTGQKNGSTRYTQTRRITTRHQSVVQLLASQIIGSCITVLPYIRQKSQVRRKTIKTRDKWPRDVPSLGPYLLEIPWDSVLSQSESGGDKSVPIARVINSGLNIIISKRSVRVHQSDRPWLNPDLIPLIHNRQRAFSSGDTLLFKFSNNFKADRERKRCREIYYKKKECRT